MKTLPSLTSRIQTITRSFGLGPLQDAFCPRATILGRRRALALSFVFALLLASTAVAFPILGNYPDASLALSTDTTVPPDAPPTNTTSINVSTSTDFKGTLAGDPTTGVVRVTDAHPAGTYTVTVTAFDSGGASAIKSFRLKVTTPVTCLPVGFSAPTNFAAGDVPYSVAVGDFNGDGKQDLAVASGGLNNVSILLGDGTGNFSAPTNFVAGDLPISVAVGDFNGDGKQDLAIANAHSDNVSILLGNGTGNFSAPTNFAAGDVPHLVAVGDFNGDGKQDLAVANNDSDNMSILLGDGIGNFSAPTNFQVGDDPLSVAVGDFNGDGKQDLAVANQVSDNVSILLGNGDGTFSAPTNFSVGDAPYSVAVGDFNGDGKQDLAVANAFSDNVSILLRECPVVSTGVQGRGTIDNQGNEVTFRFRATEAEGSGTLGYLYFCDPVAGVCITNARVRTLSITGNSANFSGYGHFDNGTEVKVRASVTDNGLPGTSDTISVSFDNGYSLSGTLFSGDIRIF